MGELLQAQLYQGARVKHYTSLTENQWYQINAGVKPDSTCFRVSPECVGQIEAKALATMKQAVPGAAPLAT